MGHEADPHGAQPDNEDTRKVVGMVFQVGNVDCSNLHPEITTTEFVPRMGFELESQLQAFTPLTNRPVDKTFQLELTLGNSINHRIYQMPPAVDYFKEDDHPITVNFNERVCFNFTSSDGDHPMHLHGHHFQITAINNIPY
eukprot:UN24497